MTRLPLALSVVLVGCSLNVRTGSGTAATDTRRLAPAESLEVGGGIDVEVMSGSQDTSVTITCDDNLLDDIVTEVEGGRLILRPTRGVTLQPRTDCVARVTVGNLEAVDVSGSSDVYVGGSPLDGLTHLGMSGSGSLVVSEASGCDMTVDVSGSGAVEVDELVACVVEAAVSGSGSVDLTGSADALDADLSGSGAVRASTLRAPQADVDVSGSGEVDAYAALRARVRISGSGVVRLYGDPQSIDGDITGSGELVRE